MKSKKFMLGKPHTNYQLTRSYMNIKAHITEKLIAHTQNLSSSADEEGDVMGAMTLSYV